MVQLVLTMGMTLTHVSVLKGSKAPTVKLALPFLVRVTPAEMEQLVLDSGYESFTCQCPAGFEGVVCQNAIPPPCSSNPCRNGATCNENGFTSYSCVCPDGYRGLLCQEEIPVPCESDPCRNGGTCQNNGFDSYTCDCADGLKEPGVKHAHHSPVKMIPALMALHVSTMALNHSFVSVCQTSQDPL